MSVFDAFCCLCVSPPQTIKKVEEGEGSEHEQAVDEKSPSVMSFSESSLYRRKNTKGSSFIGSEGEKEERGKEEDDKTEEVRCSAVSQRCDSFCHRLCLN